MTIQIVNTPTNVDSLPTVLFDNFLASATLTATTEAVGYPKENAVKETTTKSWKPTALPANLSFDLGTAKALDSFAIVAHNCGTSGNTLYLEWSTDNTTWTTLATVIPTDDTTILILFAEVTARYWRIRVANGTAPNLSVVIGTKRLNFPAGVKAPYTPLWAAQAYEITPSTTLGGQFLGTKYYSIGGETDINLVSVERGFAENDLEPFREHYNKGKAFVWASNPTVFSKDVGYVWRKERTPMNPVFDQDGNWMAVTMGVYTYAR